MMARQRMLREIQVAAVDRNISVAHELGHWLLHGDAAADGGTRSERMRREREADRFALELLLSETLVQRVLAERRRSMEAAALRLGVRGTYPSRRIRELRRADQPFLSRGSPVRGFSDTT